MNYNSVEEIFESGTDNMTCLLLDSSSYDEATFEFDGASYLTFNGSVVETIYANGNSYLGFGSNTTHLQVNKRDARLRSLYREEGTLYKTYRFLKIRWEGWAYYNSSSYPIKYDVLLWETGDISLHMVSIPSSYYSGIFQLTADTTYTYTAPTSSSPDVTFQYESESDAGMFEVKYAIIELDIPFRVLISDANGTIYTIEEQTIDVDTGETGNVLVALSETEFSSSLFSTYGAQEFPDWDLIKGLSLPSVHTWGVAQEFPIEAAITGLPPKQYVQGTADLSHSSILGIKSLNAEYTGTVTEQHSFDGETFTDEVAMADFLLCDLDALYASLLETMTITFRFWLSGEATLTSFTMTYENGDDEDET